MFLVFKLLILNKKCQLERRLLTIFEPSQNNVRKPLEIFCEKGSGNSYVEQRYYYSVVAA